MREHAKNAVKIALDHRGQREALVRQYFFLLARRFTPTVAVDSEGMRFHMTTAERFGRVDFGLGGLDEKAIARLLDTLGEHTGSRDPLAGRAILDVGGHIGTTSIAAVRRFGAARAVAFEPSPVNRRMFHLNVAENGVGDEVSVHPIALSDHDGVVTLEISPEHAGDHRVRVDGVSGAPAAEMDEAARSSIEVPAHRLDTLVAEGRVDATDVALLWMDVQGHEAHVLAGARETLARGIPASIEFWPYGLRRAGGLERLHEIVEATFSRIVDLGPPWEERAPVVLPASDLPSLVAAYDGAFRFSDLLLLHD